MARLKIKDAPLLPVINGDEKIPTGGKGDFTLTPNMLAEHFKSNSGFATDAELVVVDNKLKSHTDNKNNPHQTTKAQVGLGSVDNTSDIDKPVSNATSIALDTKADKAQVIIDLNLKADKSTTYTKTEVDSEFYGIYQNGAALPYDAAMEYAEGAVVVKDGELQKKQGVSWVSATNKGYNLDYFVSGKSYPLHAEIMLINGDTVKSTVANNIINPNVDMTGWELADAALNTRKLKRDIVSAWDFFTPSELAIYKAAPTIFDAYRPLQEFLTYIKDNNVGTAYCNGSFSISTGLLLGGAAGSLTKQVVGFLKLKALNAIDIMWKQQAGQDFSWLGIIDVEGIGDQTFSSRTCRRGIELGSRTVISSRNKFTALKARNFYEAGVISPQLGSLSSLGFVRTIDCGSGISTEGYSLTTTYSAANSIGTGGSVAQRAVINVDVLPPADVDRDDAPMHVYINDQPYYVYDIDRANKTLTVFPWVDTTKLTGTLWYDFGGGVVIAGGDSSVLQVDMIDATRCNTALSSACLYAPVVHRIVCQRVRSGVKIGASVSSAHIGGVIGCLYVEGADNHVHKVTRSPINFNILSNVGLLSSKFAYSCAARNTSNALITYNNSSGIAYQDDGYQVTFQRNRATENLTTTVDVTSKSDADFVFYGNAASLILGTPDLGLADNFGRFKRRVVVFGSANSGAPTTVSFTVADIGTYTINGASLTSVSYTGFSGFAEFDIIFNSATNRYIITRLDVPLPLQASVTFDPPSLAAGVRDTIQTMTLTGANLGDNVNMSFSRSLAGVTLTGYVSAANTVSYYFQNNTAATVDLASGTVKAKIV